MEDVLDRDRERDAEIAGAAKWFVVLLGGGLCAALVAGLGFATNGSGTGSWAGAFGAAMLLQAVFSKPLARLPPIRRAASWLVDVRGSARLAWLRSRRPVSLTTDQASLWLGRGVNIDPYHGLLIVTGPGVVVESGVEIRGTVTLDAGAFVGRGARLVGCMEIRPYGHVGHSARLERTTLEAGAVVESGARLDRCHVKWRVRILAGAAFMDRVFEPGVYPHEEA